MYKFFLYAMLMISYLGLSKILSPREIGIFYLQNEKSFSKMVSGSSVTMILIDTHATGFIFQTFYQKYRVITDFDQVEEYIVRTNKDFAQKNIKNIGLSIYRKFKNDESYLPLPPGSLYLNKRQFGDWRRNKKGKEIWIFKKSLKNFPIYLGWGHFRPTKDFYLKLKESVSQNKSFLGLNNEFGPQGEITQKSFPQFFEYEKKTKTNFKTLIYNYFKENF